MTVHLPETGELECDKCSLTVDVDLEHYSGDPETVGLCSYTGLPEGWVHTDGEHLCPTCSKDVSDKS